MARIAARLTLVAALVLLALAARLTADPPSDADAALNRTLALQKAMNEARYFLQHGNDSQKAVALLEGQLATVNGNAEFLRLLAEAYRARIRDLYLAGQPAQTRVYLERLCVLEPAAVNDPTLQPPKEAPPPKVEVTKTPELKPASTFPNFAKAMEFFKGGKTAPAPAPAKPPVIRAQKEDETAPALDPFDLKNQRTPTADGDKATAARQLAAQGDAAFKQKHWAQARQLYERAYQIEPKLVADFREPWAYCVLDGVAEQLNQPGLTARPLAELQQEVKGAMAMSAKLKQSGLDLLQKIDERQKGPAMPAAALKHLGRNPEGWAVAETANFLIFHKQDNAFAERVALVAERTRLEMTRKWFGGDGPAWQPKCELIVHPTGQEYAQMTGVSPSSPGHSRIESDKSNAARVIARRMDMRFDSAGMLDSVLPHETTHVVLAGQFGPFPVPRWADEGIAVLTEPQAKIEQHRQNLLRCHHEGTLFGLKELMLLQEYPEPRRITAFYAQSVVLTEFLARQRGPAVLVAFVRDGLREGYDAALQRHYGLSFGQLQQMWNQQVLGGQKLAAGN